MKTDIKWYRDIETPNHKKELHLLADGHWCDLPPIDTPHGILRLMIRTRDHHYEVHLDKRGLELWLHTLDGWFIQKCIKKPKKVTWEDVCKLAEEQYSFYKPNSPDANND